MITGAPSVDGAITALREGASDFLPKPFTAEHLLKRVSHALEAQAACAKKERRLDRLRDAVKRLNEARRLVSKKVDLLCNDLITAYGELSKQLDVVRVQDLTRQLGWPLLATAPFAANVAGPWRPVGEHVLRGLDTPMPVLTMAQP